MRVHISGIVQGVGFRPFVYGLADRLKLRGWVKNTSAGVEIEVDGERDVLDTFINLLREEAPPLSRIDDLTVSIRPVNRFTSFDIVHSEAVEGAFQPISPDVSICEDCLRELFDPDDRRYRYPFINCTNCGPRFTIIQDIPYDRPTPTMAPFDMCPACEREYTDPRDRRFHAQPVACPECGPQVWLESTDGSKEAVTGMNAIDRARELLRQGKILAVKGLGGFHLACDATNAMAVLELRNRTLRVDKPFALMMPDLETVKRHALLNRPEGELLLSPARPIVLLRRRSESGIAHEVAPKQDWIGVMLPYTPLHHLLLEKAERIPEVLVMTSGNLSEEPIATGNEEARLRLSKLADAFLMHDREIHIRCDDSVVRVFDKQIYPIRRSRGYAPFPVKLPWNAPPLLAAGSELKNTFCITNQGYAFLSHHVGDMENYETLKSFEEGVAHFERLFRVRPQALACDLHPNYLATRFAQERSEREGIPLISVQHHHAHIAACMAEHRLDEPVIGASFDGTGYGEDGAIWGGEFLVAGFKDCRRAAHLEYFPLPGGDAAIKRPARTALALLWSLGLDWEDTLPPVQEFCAEDRTILRTQLEKRINTPDTSSMGRLFDAAAALAGVRQKVNYEGQAAIEFEALVDPTEKGGYHFELDGSQIRMRGAVEAMMQDVFAGIPSSRISARFHNGLAEMVRKITEKISAETGIRKVILSGGVWQNITLLGRTLSLLRDGGVQVYIHQEVPPNDGGLSLGQAVIAAARLRG
ncbi:MAG: carbamoyltransferase HypF [Chloroflexi bacterium]|nr:carbamoyltransferase HypF [Chloroflexota bacterium]